MTQVPEPGPRYEVGRALLDYARHAGHLDVACEILAGITGEC